MDGDLGDVFRLQQRLAAALAERLELTAASTARAPELDAFECYSRGRALLLQFGKEQMKEAGKYYRQAIEIDPDYAPALADLAMLNAMTFSFTTDPRVLDVASDFARRSLTTDPNNGKARAWLGYALWRQGHTRQALSEELRAIELDPTEYTVPYFAACILMEMGRPGEAVAYYQMAIDRFPRWAWAFGCLSWCHLALGNRVEARWSAEHCVELRTDSDALPFPYALAVLAECQRLHGDLDAARQSALLNLEEIERTDHAFRDLVRALGLVVLGRVALSQGDTRAARTAFDQAVEQLRGRPRGMGGGHFMVQALTGQTRAGSGAEPFEEALALFEHRGELDFSWTVTGSSDISLLELARAATTLGRDSEAGRLLERARRIGLTPVFEERL
jgi:tetratricopeptide (TPR) repeat protein